VQQSELAVEDDCAVALDAAQAAEKLPGCALWALQSAATALAAAGFEGAARQSLRVAEARNLPPGHFAGVGAGLFARSRIVRGQVLGLYGGRYELASEAEAEQKAELIPNPERVTPPRFLALLFELDVASLVVDAMSRAGAPSWGGCVNSRRWDVEDGEDGSVANVAFVRGVRGARVAGPLPGLRLPLLFCVATRDIHAGAELLMDYGSKYWDLYAKQQGRVAAVKREESAKRKAPAHVAARAECDCLRLGSGITPELCTRCNPGTVLLKGGRTLRHRQQATVALEATPPAKRSRRSLGSVLDASSAMEHGPTDAHAMVAAACDAVPCLASLLALHREMMATVVPAALRAAADAAAAAAEHASRTAALCDSVRNAAEPLRAMLLLRHGAKLAADAGSASVAAAAAEECRVAAERNAMPLMELRVPNAPHVPGFDAAAACARFSGAEPAALLHAYRLAALPRVASAAEELPRSAAARFVVAAAMAAILSREARELEAALARDVPLLLAAAAAARDERVAEDVRTESEALLAAARADAAAARARASAARAACV